MISTQVILLLNDILSFTFLSQGTLVQTLREVRPTLLFGVPRYYNSASLPLFAVSFMKYFWINLGFWETAHLPLR